MVRPKLKHLTKQDKDGYHRGRFKIDPDPFDRLRTEWLSVVCEPFGHELRAEWRPRKCARKKHDDHAVEVGHANTYRDEREHIWMAPLNRTPAAFEKRPSSPENDGRAENKLNPTGLVVREPRGRVRNEMRHGQEKHRQGQGRSDPETAAHVDQFRVIFSGIRRNCLEFQRHSTNRAFPRLIALNLRVHRAGVDCSGMKFLFRGTLVWCDCLIRASVLSV